MNSVRVNLGSRSYDIALTSGDSKSVGAFVRAGLPKTTTALVVGDSNTQLHGRVLETALIASGFRTAFAPVPAGEPSKCLEQLSALYDALYGLAADRQTCVVAVGGGVIGDLAGFAAATYNRGLPLVMVPTSLLAMVDSSVGGKTGINHPKGKNLIGAFHQPAGVWIDLALLTTLPEREYLSGLAEVVKYGVILDSDFFSYLEANTRAVRERQPEVLLHVVGRCCRLKADVVEKDEYETTGLRAVLNYGHTFAHGFETLAGYGTLLHGEAVAIGMTCAATLAERLGLVGADFVSRQTDLLVALGLPTAPGHSYPTEELISVMRRDKKAVGGQMRFILPTRLGEVKLFDDVPEPLVRAVLQSH
ncbi:3-dehydroquinate synthase [Frigoriglobus tundricola]|uniref:3-dehydroquinate synthase n=1 Tax=Frigoriglobus tundricola TaxID=2774151 RepID=A0A6M5Z044_9BACT|nr:3-dehydroquinate synthase [Frigoriglobus tundricola]QJW99020.1 3-dehydroquinate synthase [Frigoriglobus tundricola]